MPEAMSARAPRIPLPPVFSGQTKGWRRWRHQMEAYCNATGMKQAMMMTHRDCGGMPPSLDEAFLDLVAEAEEHEDVEAPSHNQVVTQFLVGLRPEYEPIIGILQVTAEHEGRAITWEGDCLKLAQNYSKRIENELLAQANQREHDLDSHNMHEIISLSGLSDCSGMSDEADSAFGGTGGSAHIVTKSDSAYSVDADAPASALVNARDHHAGAE
eukprot:jgi/Tetstr1/447557/TSEL_034936.t1